MNRPWKDPNPFELGVPKKGTSAMNFQDGIDAPPRKMMGYVTKLRNERCYPPCGDWLCTRRGGGIMCRLDRKEPTT